ncbi:MAG: GNAT family N-acetyltransferase [bacterium]
MIIKGNKIELKSAKESDGEKIYTWLTQSNLTPPMMGLPNYPDHPIPSWEEFCKDYTFSFFNISGDGKGRNYIIVVDSEEIGTIGYDLLDKQNGRVIMDLWIRSEKYYGHSYGSDALNTLCNYIHKNYGIKNFIISPSSRNKRAIAAYKKAEFRYIKFLNKEEQKKEFKLSEYDDIILMIKKLITKQCI